MQFRIGIGFFIGLTCLVGQLFASPPNFRLVITGGLLGIHDGERAFYESALFRVGTLEDEVLGSFVIEDAQKRAWSTGNAIFFSVGKMDADALIKATFYKRGVVTGMQASQLYGVDIDAEGLPRHMPDSALRREVGGVLQDVRWEARRVDKQLIVAINIASDKSEIVWPKSISELHEVDGVLGLYPKTGSNTLFFPRSLGSTARTFGIVDQLLKQQPDIPTRYVDLGNALSSLDNESLIRAREMNQLLLARQPAVLGVGRYDLHALVDDTMLAKSAPYVAALIGSEDMPNIRVVEIGGKQVQFTVFGNEDPSSSGFLPKNIRQMTLVESIRTAEKKAALRDVVIGLADGVNVSAISSPVFDMVLSLVKTPWGALPAQDDMNLLGNLKTGLSAVAPLVRVSGTDVTELSVWVDAEGRVTRLSIHRHPIIDGGVVAKDAQAILSTYEKEEQTIALPKRNWNQSDLNDVLGAILLRSNPEAELVLMEQVDAATQIYSSIPVDLAEPLLSRPGRVVSMSINGKYLKRILKASKNRQFDLPIVMYGGSMTGPTIGKREIVDAESYNIMVTERVLLEIDNFVAREALFASSPLAASSLQTALFESNKEPLKILSELRKRESRDNAKIGEKRDLLMGTVAVAEVTREALKVGMSELDVDRFILDAQGRLKPALIFEVSDLDLGFKGNFVNETLRGWQKALDDKLKEGAFAEPRFFDEHYLNVLIYGKIALKYIGQKIDSELSSSLKFFQPNTDLKLWLNKDKLPDLDTVKELRPGKDVFKIEAEFRLPLERLLTQPKRWAWMLSPLVRLTWETNIWPNPLMTSLPVSAYPRRLNDSRLFLGISGKPMLGEEIFRVGAVINYDFSQTTPLQSVAFGPELGAAGKWNWGLITFKLETTLRDLYPIVLPDPKGIRTGLTWLADAKAEVPIYGGFSVSAMLNFTIGSLMEDRTKIGVGTMCSLALSYGNRLKWLL